MLASKKISMGMIMIISSLLLHAQRTSVSSIEGEVPFKVNEVIERVSHYRSAIAISPIPEYAGNTEKSQHETITHWSRAGEFIMDTSIAYVPAYHEQEYASVAFGSTNYLVVWTDSRCDPDRNYHSFYSSDIYCARIDTSGVILDPGGIAISTAANMQTMPSVSFDGTNYLVVWQDHRNPGGLYDDIYGARIDTSGTVLDPLGIAISTAPNFAQNPSVVFDGTNYLVVWQDTRNGTHDIYGTRLSQTGQVLDLSGIAISTAANNQWYPSITFDGTNYLVAWNDFRNGVDSDIYGARVDTSGSVLDSAGIAISTAANNQWRPSVASDGTDFLVTWHDYRNGVNGDIYGARVDSSGLVRDPSGLVISTAANDEMNSSVAFDGVNYLVVWQFQRGDSSYDIYGVRVDTSGSVLGPSGIAVSIAARDQLYSALACDGGKYLVVWQDYRNGESGDIYGARVTTSGTALDPSGIAISTAANDQWHSSAAFDGTNYLVVWHDQRSDSSHEIYGMRMDTSGTVLDPSGIVISTSEHFQKYPSVAFDGVNYLVVWQSQRNDSTYDIYGARVDTLGTVLDPSGITISDATGDQLYPVVASGENSFVVWEDYRNGTSGDIYGARVDTSGTVLDPSGIAISATLFGNQYPWVVFGGTYYLVVWYTFVPGPDILNVIGARVDTSGTVVDPSGIAVSPYDEDALYPSVAFDGTNYVVVWADNRNTGYMNITGARVDTSGKVLDLSGIPITTEEFFQYYPAVTFDGTNYVIAWEQWPSGHMYSDIYGAKITPQMQVIDTFAVSVQSGNQYLPTLAHGVGNQVLVTYSGFTDSINVHPTNTMRIWGTFGPFTGIEETGGEMSPSAYNLEIYPCPFRDYVTIGWSTRSNIENCELRIFDVTGRVVRNYGNLTNEQVRLGRLVWNGLGDYGFRLPPGVYFVTLESDSFTAVRKVILLR